MKNKRRIRFLLVLLLILILAELLIIVSKKKIPVDGRKAYEEMLFEGQHNLLNSSKNLIEDVIALYG